MNRRVSYALFEKMVLYLYDRKLLTVDLLDYIADRYRRIGVDRARISSLRARDGKDLCQVCITCIDPTFPIAIEGSSGDNEEYWEQEQKKWEGIMRTRWGWRTLRTKQQHLSENQREVFKIPA